MDINKYTPKFKISQGNLLRLSDVTAEDIFEILYLAKALKKKVQGGRTYARTQKQNGGAFVRKRIYPHARFF